MTQEPRPLESAPVPVTAPAAAPKSKKYGWIAIGAGALAVCACLALCIGAVATGAGSAMVEKAPIESVLDSFMKDMESKDVQSAYALFSPRSRKQTPLSDLEKMDEGNNYMLFEGYRSLTVRNLNLTAAVNTNPDLPQGTVANVSGVVTYDNGITGELSALLEKVDGAWKIYNIHITAPPDKFDPDSQGQPEGTF